jgi:hypothetical protein
MISLHERETVKPQEELHLSPLSSSKGMEGRWKEVGPPF